MSNVEAAKDAGAARRPVVVAGVPRSGTTWTMRALGSCARTSRVPEGDNEDFFPAAIHAKHGLGRFPLLAPGEPAPAFLRLWAWILDGAHESRRATWARKLLVRGRDDRSHDGRFDLVTLLAATLARDPRPQPDRREPGLQVIAKSIHLEFALEWLVHEFDVAVLVLLRHPASVLASWKEVQIKDARQSALETRADVRARYLEPWGVRAPGPDPIERMSWRIALLTAALEDAVGRHPEWQVRTHEELCLDPLDTFRSLAGALGLEWGEEAERYLQRNDVPGVGFTTQRVAIDLPGSWQSRLDDAELATLRRVLDEFPITTWSGADFARTGP